MTDASPIAPHARTWREIPQQVKARAMSHEGRKRFILSGAKTTGLILLVATMAWGTFEIISTWRTEPKRIADAANLAPLQEKDLVLVTDGVLDKAWLTGRLALPKNATLMELDIYQLQARLAAFGQVKSAVVTKNFPATLMVTIAERSPVARLRADTGLDFLVDRDGVVFAGTGHDPEMIGTLPWLDGVKLIRIGEGFAPIPNMSVVANLLVRGREEAPQFYLTWKVVDLARIATDAEIEVRSSEIPRMIFSTELDFTAQVSRLNYARNQPGPAMKSINLGLGAQAVVTYDAGAARPRAVPDFFKPSAPALSAFPNLQRSPKSNRDL
jgi:POTRA domain, FtsQ-type